LSQGSKRSRQEDGQASVMIGMIILTFILFFAFVINTGMLVNAKINLQNAADLAAYSGAAVQARQLNNIAYLNYEMRRQYKKFIFRYYVLGTAMYTTYPTDSGRASRSPRDWRNRTTMSGTSPPQAPIPWSVPVVCVNFFSRDGGYCAVNVLEPISLPRRNILDSINEALRQQLIALEKIRANSCQTIADTNIQLLSLWLFNTAPGGINPADMLTASLPPEQAANITQAFIQMRGLTYGLGLVPRELILQRRIDTLETYLNTAPRSGVTADVAQAMKNSPEPHSVERTINAFESAYQTLGEHSFPGQDVALDELIPPGPDGANMVLMKPILQDFDTYALTYSREDDGSTGEGIDTKKSCKPRAFPITIRRLPLGVYKDPSILTYYAIRLRGKAKVLFSPWGDLELKAYSAAMPFGSRIGPPPEKVTDFLTRPGRVPANFLAEGTTAGGTLFRSLVGAVPNLPIFKGEGTGPGGGWDSNYVQHQYYRLVVPSGNSINMADVSRGFQASMVPNPWEEGLYTIPNDLNNQDPFIRNFDKYRNSAVWAPLAPLNQSSQIVDLLRQDLDEIFADNTGSTGIDPNRVGAAFSLASFKSTILNSLAGYVAQLRTGQGESDPYTFDNPAPPDLNREGINVALITDPFSSRPTDGVALGPIGIDPAIIMREPAQVRDAWNKVNDSAFRAARRVGYSVKFVSFDSLMRGFTTDTKGTTFTNDVDLGSGDAGADLPMVKH
jgi:hypothetical protein